MSKHMFFLNVFFSCLEQVPKLFPKVVMNPLAKSETNDVNSEEKKTDFSSAKAPLPVMRYC